jgi:hypothetical protein
VWRTNNGDRTLEGTEARLFADAVWDFVQELEISEGDYDVDLPVFDRLTYGQKGLIIRFPSNRMDKRQGGSMRSNIIVRNIARKDFLGGLLKSYRRAA